MDKYEIREMEGGSAIDLIETERFWCKYSDIEDIGDELAELKEENKRVKDRLFKIESGEITIIIQD